MITDKQKREKKIIVDIRARSIYCRNIFLFKMLNGAVAQIKNAYQKYLFKMEK